MTHVPPTTREEYMRMYQRNLRLEGYGPEVTQIMPCPFCAAPDFQTVRVIHAHDDLAGESTCAACGRSGASIVEAGNGGTTVEFVQTGGDDPPEWLRPWPRRAEAGA